MGNNDLFDAISKAFHFNEMKEFHETVIEILEDESLSLEEKKAKVREVREKYEYEGE